LLEIRDPGKASEGHREREGRGAEQHHSRAFGPKTVVTRDFIGKT
jgi:hypothetical protein